jgi:hypothetical protein
MVMFRLQGWGGGGGGGKKIKKKYNLKKIIEIPKFPQKFI